MKRIQKLLRLVEADENDVSAHFDLGLDFYNPQKYEDSLSHFLKAKELGYDPVTIDEWIDYSCTSLGSERYSHPFFWAPFIMIGSWW